MFAFLFVDCNTPVSQLILHKSYVTISMCWELRCHQQKLIVLFGHLKGCQLRIPWGLPASITWSSEVFALHFSANFYFFLNIRSKQLVCIWWKKCFYFIH